MIKSTEMNNWISIDSCFILSRNFYEHWTVDNDNSITKAKQQKNDKETFWRVDKI